MRSAAVSPWTLNALARFPPFVCTISASAVGVIAAATSAQPNVARPAEAKTTSNTTQVVSRHTEVERCLAGLQQEAKAENDDPGASDESDQ
jgi:hypothetical protein